MPMYAAVLLLIDIAKNIKMFMTVKATSYMHGPGLAYKAIQHGRTNLSAINRPL